MARTPFYTSSEGQINTPRRCGVLFTKAYSQELGIPIPQSLVLTVTGIAPRSQSRILYSKQARTLHNQPDSGPDPRGRKRALTRRDTSLVSDYLDDSNVSLDEKGKPWHNIVEAAGIPLPNTTHFKPFGTRIVNAKSVQKTCRDDEGIINAMCEEKKELTKIQANARVDWCNEQLTCRPHSRHWKDVAYCNKFHFGIGPQITKRIKRKKGPVYRYKPENVHRKKVIAKDTKAKAREEEHLKLLNVFVVIGYNYRRVIPYEIPGNRVGKMATKVYTEIILPEILEDLKEKGLTLCQAADSAHESRGTIAWAEKHDLPLITLPGVSSDLSILEIMAHSLKKKFHAKCCASNNAALAVTF